MRLFLFIVTYAFRAVRKFLKTGDQISFVLWKLTYLPLADEERLVSTVVKSSFHIFGSQVLIHVWSNTFRLYKSTWPGYNSFIGDFVEQSSLLLYQKYTHLP